MSLYVYVYQCGSGDLCEYVRVCGSLGSRVSECLLCVCSRTPSQMFRDLPDPPRAGHVHQPPHLVVIVVTVSSCLGSLGDVPTEVTQGKGKEWKVDLSETGPGPTLVVRCKPLPTPGS